VVAFGHDGFVVAVHDDPATLDGLHFDALAALVGKRIDGGAPASTRVAPDVLVASTASWADRGDGGGALAAMFDDAPPDTIAAVVARPHDARLRSLSVWLRWTGDGLHLDADARFADARDAEALASELSTWTASLKGAMPGACAGALDAITDAVHVDRDGDTVHASASLPKESLGALTACGMSFAGSR
jgi:hypothetical protein